MLSCWSDEPRFAGESWVRSCFEESQEGLFARRKFFSRGHEWTRLAIMTGQVNICAVSCEYAHKIRIPLCTRGIGGCRGRDRPG